MLNPARLLLRQTRHASGDFYNLGGRTWLALTPEAARAALESELVGHSSDITRSQDPDQEADQDWAEISHRFQRTLTGTAAQTRGSLKAKLLDGQGEVELGAHVRNAVAQVTIDALLGHTPDVLLDLFDDYSTHLHRVTAHPTLSHGSRVRLQSLTPLLESSIRDTLVRNPDSAAALAQQDLDINVAAAVIVWLSAGIHVPANAVINLWTTLATHPTPAPATPAAARRILSTALTAAPPVWILHRHVFSNGVVLSQRVDAGDTLLVCPWLIAARHRGRAGLPDSALANWADPGTTNLMFGAGPHRCPGQSLGLVYLRDALDAWHELVARGGRVEVAGPLTFDSRAGLSLTPRGRRSRAKVLLPET